MVYDGARFVVVFNESFKNFSVSKIFVDYLENSC